MAEIPAAGKLAAHVLIDAVSTYEFGAPPEVNIAAMNLALQRVNDIDGALTATIGDSGSVALDASNLLGGIMVSINWLVTALAESRGVDNQEVITELRDFLDT